MRISRIYIPLHSSELATKLILPTDKAHYVRNVLRLKQGERLNFFCRDGLEFCCLIDELSRNKVVLGNLEQNPQMSQPATIEVTIIQSISSGDRMNYTVQKAAEMGGVRLIPVFSEHVSQKIAKHKWQQKQQHWQAVAISACEQSGRCDLLTVEPIQQLSEVLPEFRAAGIYLEPTVSAQLSQIPPKLRQQTAVFIGPEGGFSETELQSFVEHELTPVRLGNRILRTETVAPVILSALHTLYGDF